MSQVEVESLSYGPIPKIPRYPPDEPALMGVPARPEDSAFATTDFVPFAETYELIAGFEASFTRDQQQEDTENFARRLLAQPHALRSLFESINQVKQLKLFRTDNVNNLKESVAQGFEKAARTAREDPDPVLLRSYLTLAAHKPESTNEKREEELSSAAERVLKGYVERTKTPRGIIRLFNNLCLAALESQDPKVEAYMGKVLGYQTPVFTSHQDQCVLYYQASQSDDDEVLGMSMDVDNVSWLLWGLYDESLQQTTGNVAELIYFRPTFAVYLEGQKRKHPKRVEDLMDYYKREFVRDISEQDFEQGSTIDILESEEPFPYNIVHRYRPLRKAYLERYIETHQKEETDLIIMGLPDGRIRVASAPKGEGQIAAYTIVSAAYQRGQGGEVTNVFSTESGLNYLRPYTVAEEAYPQFENLTETYRNRLYAPDWFILSSVEELVVSDPHLVEAGVSSISYEVGPNLSTNVTIHIGKYDVVVLLDKEYLLKHASGADLAIDDKSRIWWEMHILAHLEGHLLKDENRKRRSIEVVEKTTKSSGVENQPEEDMGEEEGEENHDHGFRRELPPDHCYTLDQRKRVLKATGGRIDIHDYNVRLKRIEEQRENERDQSRPRALGRVYTWVIPGYQEDVPQQKRHAIYRVPHATDKIQEILQQFSESSSE